MSINPYREDIYDIPSEQTSSGGETATISTPDDGEVHLTPKAASTGGAEGTMFYNSLDDHVYVGTEA